MPQELLRPPHQIPVNHVASRLPRPPHARLPLPQRPQLFRVFPLRPRSLQRHLPSFPVKLRDSRPRHQRSRARSSRSIPPQRRRSRVRLPSSSRHVRPPAPRQPRDRRARHRLFDRFRRVSPRRPDVRVVVHRVARHARGRSRSTRFDSIRSPTVVRVEFRAIRARARPPTPSIGRRRSLARRARSSRAIARRATRGVRASARDARRRRSIDPLARVDGQPVTRADRLDRGARLEIYRRFTSCATVYGREDADVRSSVFRRSALSWPSG